MRSRRSLPLVVAASLSLGGCTRLVGVDLQLAEPCGQETQALNGISSFRIVSSGAEPDGVVSFQSSAPQQLTMGLGESVIVSVEAYSEDITVGADPNAPTVAPVSVGRTMPTALDASTASLTGMLLVGRVRGFGSPRSLDGTCPTMTAGEDVPGRHGHTVTYIPKVNKVLIYGGAVIGPTGSESFLKSAEVFDPVTGTFSPLPTPVHARAYHTATALPDGRVVIVGGFSKLNNNTETLGPGVVVDVTNEEQPYFIFASKLARAHHTATFLPEAGLIAVIGGCTTGASADDACAPDRATRASTNAEPTVEVLDITDFATGGQPASARLTTARAMHTAIAVPSSNLIVVAGGLNSNGPLDSIEVFQVGSGSLVNVTSVAGKLPRAVVRHQMTALDEGRFAVSGGLTVAPGGILPANDAATLSSGATAEVNICALSDGTLLCQPGVPLPSPRYGHAMTRLRDGRLLVIGGLFGGDLGEAALLQNPAAQQWEATGPLAESRERAAFTLLGDDGAGGSVNQIFYSGGINAQGVTSNRTDIYFGP
jgi:hypothetical protein